MRRALALALLASLLLAGCNQPAPAQTPTPEPLVVNGQTMSNNTLQLEGAEGISVTTNATGVRLGLGGDVRIPNGSLQACDGACDELGALPGAIIAEAALGSFGNLSLNSDGPDTDSHIYFYDGGSFNGQWIAWADRARQFEMSGALVVGGNLTSSGHVGTTTVLQAPDGTFLLHTGALEGPEAAVYLRGSGALVNGTANITFPPAWSELVGTGLITAQVTLTSRGVPVFVSEKARDHIRVETIDGSDSEATFDFFVQAPRRGQEAFTFVRPVD